MKEGVASRISPHTLEGLYAANQTVWPLKNTKYSSQRVSCTICCSVLHSAKKIQLVNADLREVAKLISNTSE